MRVAFARGVIAAALAVSACSVAPPESVTPTPAPSAAPAQGSRATDILGVVAYAASLEGTPYREGGNSPRQGFDCSGFVQHVYAQLGIRLPRNTQQMAAQLTRIPAHAPQPGDLVFFNTKGSPHSHVGIYLGNDEFVHAPSERGGGVMISNLNQPYWRARLDGVRRPSDR